MSNDDSPASEKLFCFAFFLLIKFQSETDLTPSVAQMPPGH